MRGWNSKRENGAPVEHLHQQNPYPQGTSFISKPVKRLKQVWKDYNESKTPGITKHQFKFPRRQRYLRKALDSWLNSVGSNDKCVEEVLDKQQDEMINVDATDTNSSNNKPLEEQLKEAPVILKIDSDPNPDELRKFVQNLCVHVRDKLCLQENQRWDRLLLHHSGQGGSSLVGMNKQDASENMVQLVQMLRNDQTQLAMNKQH
eukprot:TRINITY_DN8688_c0_g1_i3.p1 TRINITY_DN8688_c0_g1~~TRINITY_DN8688_c0_g1_i3.p1  ORF type:complete len:204 (-),score=23.03 TRINITY_DN8688_c0_g1_i3:118-729(-)